MKSEVYKVTPRLKALGVGISKMAFKLISVWFVLKILPTKWYYVFWNMSIKLPPKSGITYIQVKSHFVCIRHLYLPFGITRLSKKRYKRAVHHISVRSLPVHFCIGVKMRAEIRAKTLFPSNYSKISKINTKHCICYVWNVCIFIDRLKMWSNAYFILD